MSAAATDAAPPKKGNKKLIIIIAVAVTVLALGGGTAVLLMKKTAAHAEAEDGADEGAGQGKKSKAAKADPKAVPIFVPLDPFTVNLADRQAERFAQVGITLEVSDPKIDAQIKAYMPVIRNNILLALADNTATELMSRDGKTKLAVRIQYETAMALGYDVQLPTDDKAADAADETPKKRSKKEAEPVELPVHGVHFSNFIIQ